jgi:hypothetical protein
MDAAPRALEHRDSIRHACWMVRYYRRGARVQMHRAQRAAAIAALFLACRAAFNAATPDDYEPLLAELVDGLRPRDDAPF